MVPVKLKSAADHNFTPALRDRADAPGTEETKGFIFHRSGFPVLSDASEHSSGSNSVFSRNDEHFRGVTHCKLSRCVKYMEDFFL